MDFFEAHKATVQHWLSICVFHSHCSVEVCIKEETCSWLEVWAPLSSPGQRRSLVLLPLKPQSILEMMASVANAALPAELRKGLAPQWASGSAQSSHNADDQACKRGRCWKARCQACALDP